MIKISIKDFKLPIDADRIIILSVKSGLNKFILNGKELSNECLPRIVLLNSNFDLALEVDSLGVGFQETIEKHIKAGFTLKELTDTEIHFTHPQLGDKKVYAGDVMASIIKYKYAVRDSLDWSEACSLRVLNVSKIQDSSYDEAIELNLDVERIDYIDLSSPELSNARYFRVDSIRASDIDFDVEVGKVYPISQTISLKDRCIALGVRRVNGVVFPLTGEARGLPYGDDIELGLRLSRDGMNFSKNLTKVKAHMNTPSPEYSKKVVYASGEPITADQITTDPSISHIEITYGFTRKRVSVKDFDREKIILGSGGYKVGLYTNGKKWKDVSITFVELSKIEHSGVKRRVVLKGKDLGFVPRSVHKIVSYNG